MDFYDILLAKKLSGGGGGGSTLIDKNISSNGTYNASSDDADGYKKVVVDVSGDDPEDFTGGNILAITSHGTEYIMTDFYGNIGCLSSTKMSDNNKTQYEGYWSMNSYYNFSTFVVGLQRNGNTDYSMNVKMGKNTLAYEGVNLISGDVFVLTYYTLGLVNANATKPLVICGNYYNNNLETNYGAYTFYGLNILDEHFKYVARFMPWLDNGEACVKDIISGKIYKNTGTGAFDYIDLEGVVHNA